MLRYKSKYKTVGVLPIRIVKSNVLSVAPSSERNRKLIEHRVNLYQRDNHVTENMPNSHLLVLKYVSLLIDLANDFLWHDYFSYINSPGLFIYFLFLSREGSSLEKYRKYSNTLENLHVACCKRVLETLACVLNTRTRVLNTRTRVLNTRWRVVCVLWYVRRVAPFCKNMSPEHTDVLL